MYEVSSYKSSNISIEFKQKKKQLTDYQNENTENKSLLNDFIKLIETINVT